jgi:hypothetical protein
MNEELVKSRAELRAAMEAANFNTKDGAYRAAQIRYNELLALKNRDPESFGGK